MQVTNGPQLRLVLRANVTMPDMQVSTETLDFKEVTCGNCYMMGVQLMNTNDVTCEWTSVVNEREKKVGVNYFGDHLQYI